MSISSTAVSETSKQIKRFGSRVLLYIISRYNAYVPKAKDSIIQRPLTNSTLKNFPPLNTNSTCQRLPEESFTCLKLQVMIY